MSEVAKDLQWRRIYWVNGKMASAVRNRNEVRDPPCSGWNGALVLGNPEDDRSLTIFCPYTFESWRVSTKSAELELSKDASVKLDWLLKHLTDTWNTMQRRGWQRDYDIAAKVFRMLDQPVPEQIMKDGEEDTRRKGGKETAAALKKPVKLSSKRGKFLEWYLRGDLKRSIRETMLEFDMSRSNALSYLFMLQKDHGIGYELTGDTAVVHLPAGCTNPFDKPWELTTADDDDDDDWLEAAAEEPAPADNDDWLEEAPATEVADDSWLD